MPDQNDTIIATLAPNAAAAAREFLASCPDAILTSGRRSLASQAAAMASDIVLDPLFVQKTYRHNTDGTLTSPVAQACQDWVNQHIVDAAMCIDGGTIAAGLCAVLSAFSDAQLLTLSSHLSGLAFDVHVDNDPAKVFVLNQLAKQYNGLLLTQEGGLPRLHLQVAA